MIIQTLEQGGHKWEKINLVTKLSPRGGYDQYKCKYCGCVGKSYWLGKIAIPQRYAYKAPLCKKQPTYGRLRVTKCGAMGPQFANITPGSIHDIVLPPAGESDSRGKWVKGVSEPVLLLWGEFELLD